jgi:hypothetical protein
MNFGEMITMVRTMLGETDSDNSYFSNDEIQTILNTSILRVASDIPTNLTFKEVVTTGDTQRYGLPTDFLQLKDVQCYVTGETNRWQLQRLNYDEFEAVAGGNTDMTGQPAYYRVEFGATSTSAGSPGGDLWLYPVPVDDSFTIRVVYYQKPTELSLSTEVTELPEFLHSAICYHSAWLLSMKDDNQSKINNLAAMYKDEINEARKTVNRRDRTGPTFIRTPYGGSSLIGRGGMQARRGPLR